MKLFPPEERARRLKVLQEETKKESWKIVVDSMEAWCYAESRSVIELHSSGKHKEAEELALKIWAVRRFYQEPEVIMRKTESWLKRFEWLKKIAPEKREEKHGA